MKAQLCPCPNRELGAKQQGDALLFLDGERKLGPLYAADTRGGQGRLVLEEKACDYFKCRHFPFSGITVAWELTC